MDKDRAYKILRDQKLIIIYTIGRPEFDKLKNFMVSISNDPEFDLTFNVLIDLSGSFIKHEISQIDKLLGFAFNEELFGGVKKVVFITETPQQVVVPYLMKTESENSPINIEITSTLEAATETLGLSDFDLIVIKEAIQEMKASK